MYSPQDRASGDDPRNAWGTRVLRPLFEVPTGPKHAYPGWSGRSTFQLQRKAFGEDPPIDGGIGKPGEPETLIPQITQETLAEMIGTTRSRVTFFMNRFRKMGFIEYNGRIQVHKSLLNVILHDQLPEQNAEKPPIVEMLKVQPKGRLTAIRNWFTYPENRLSGEFKNELPENSAFRKFAHIGFEVAQIPVFRNYGTPLAQKRGLLYGRRRTVAAAATVLTVSDRQMYVSSARISVARESVSGRGPPTCSTFFIAGHSVKTFTLANMCIGFDRTWGNVKSEFRVQVRVQTSVRTNYGKLR
jgi:Crp-like helix-turn-helix domain